MDYRLYFLYLLYLFLLLEQFLCLKKLKNKNLFCFHNENHLGQNRKPTFDLVNLYRVENRILPVVFFFDIYGMLQDNELIFCIEAILTFI